MLSLIASTPNTVRLEVTLRAVSFLQPLNAAAYIASILSGRLICSRSLQPSKALAPMEIIADPSLIVTVSRPSQSTNADSLMVTTLAGISSSSMDSHLENANAGISVRAEESLTSSSFVSPANEYAPIEVTVSSISR